MASVRLKDHGLGVYVVRVTRPLREPHPGDGGELGIFIVSPSGAASLGFVRTLLVESRSSQGFVASDLSCLGDIVRAVSVDADWPRAGCHRGHGRLATVAGVGEPVLVEVVEKCVRGRVVDESGRGSAQRGGIARR